MALRSPPDFQGLEYQSEVLPVPLASLAYFHPLVLSVGVYLLSRPEEK